MRGVGFVALCTAERERGGGEFGRNKNKKDGSLSDSVGFVELSFSLFIASDLYHQKRDTREDSHDIERYLGESTYLFNISVLPGASTDFHRSMWQQQTHGSDI